MQKAGSQVRLVGGAHTQQSVLRDGDSWQPNGAGGGLAFLAAAIGLTTLWVALNTRSWDELEAVLIPPLIVGVAIAAG